MKQETRKRIAAKVKNRTHWSNYYYQTDRVGYYLGAVKTAASVLGIPITSDEQNEIVNDMILCRL